MNKVIGFVGLGRMGNNMVANLVEQGYEVKGFDTQAEARSQAQDAGVEVFEDYEGLVSALPEKKLVWLMVPGKFVDDVLEEVMPLLQPGDTVVDGGNSFYVDSIKRHNLLNSKNINYLDCGVSGGMSGARNGASIMVGGDKDVFLEYEDVFKTLATEDGYALVGQAGAGHFVKMVHNGIEYGMMGAIAEGMNVLKEHQEQFAININEVLKPYQHESIITSKLVDWLAEAYQEGQIDKIVGEVPQGETEFEMEHIVSFGITPVLLAALEQRKATRKNPSYTGKLISAMRNQFGGHKVIDAK